MIYDVLLVGLCTHKTTQQISHWVRNISASSLTEATQKAIQLHPITGCTPSQVSMAWAIYPQA